LNYFQVDSNVVEYLFVDSIRPSLMKIPKAMNDYLTSNRIRRQAAATNELNSELDLLDKPVKDEYTKAYTNGRNKGGCLEQYSCPISLFTPIHLHS